MFERLKGENEVWKNKRKICTEKKLSKSQVRKNEIHGLKDILVRENEKIQREQVTLRFYPRFIYGPLHMLHFENYLGGDLR